MVYRRIWLLGNKLKREGDDSGRPGLRTHSWQSWDVSATSGLRTGARGVLDGSEMG